MAAVLQSDDELRTRFTREFQRIRAGLPLYPDATARPAAIFADVAQAVRSVAGPCLPLGIAIAMHLYPLCALQCAPLPALSIAGFKRRILVKAIRERSMIVANAGSERANGTHDPVALTLTADGLRASGTFEYVSLASVADLVLFSARCGPRIAVCAADIRGDSARIGAAKFGGRMQLSDTRSLTFENHRIPRGRYLLAADAPATQCIFDYQRCWFHLLLSEAYLARIELLQRGWRLPDPVEHLMAANEISCLRDYAARLLDECRPQGCVERLTRVTSLLKLRVSSMAQDTARLLRETAPDDAAELGYMKMQPTSDDRILRSLGA